MNVRHTYPSGQTSASKIKALLLCLEAKKGAAAADAWLEKVRLARTDLDDETRVLPLAALRTALEAFLVEVPDGEDAVAPYMIRPENLGVWARVLRGTRAPEEAFGRIDSNDSEHGRTTRWETIEAKPGMWKGKVRIGHDPALEKDGLLARARAAELAVVPMLFGFERATIERGPVTDDAQEFTVRWALPTATRGLVAGALGGAALGTAVLAPHPTALGAIAALVLPAAFGAAGYAWGQTKLRGVESRAQAMRVAALERSLALRETEGRANAGDLENTVVAGQYRLGARMGSGASGAVYQATRITDGLPVAIKLLRAAAAHDAVASDRLRRESEALGLAWHPNVVEVIDHGHLPDGTSYLVMELLVGDSLQQRLRRTGPMTADEVLPIATQLADALVAIHAAGVVHRDLKPGNIFLVKGEGGDRVKILDFGIARVEWEEMRITNMGAPLGTPGYMSPEQERGGEIDARSDLFAIGAVLYECFVGEPPPPAAADMWKPGKRPASSVRVEVAASGVHPASKRMASVAPAPAEVPVKWRAIVERALAKSPDDRYQDARALLTALRGLGAETPPASEASTSS